MKYLLSILLLMGAFGASAQESLINATIRNISSSAFVVQSGWTTVATATATITLNNVKAGNMVIVTAAVVSDTVTFASGNLSDGVSAYTLDANPPRVSTFFNFASFSKIAGVNGSLTIVLTPGNFTPGAINMCAYEVSNLKQKSFDVAAATINTGSSTTPSSNTFTTTAPGIILAQEEDDTGSTPAHSAGANFVISKGGQALNNDNSGALLGGCAEERITFIPLSNTSASCVATPSQTWHMWAVAYK